MAFAGAAQAADPLENLRYAISGGTPNLDLRLRYEGVKQTNGLEEADALTVRTRLGYTTGKWNQLDVSAEFEGVNNIGSDQYDNNPAPTAGRTGYSVVADPRGNELNQAWVRYTGIPDTVLKIGRQRIVLDNARWIGNVGWRQNEATYDGYLLTNTSVPKTTVNVAFITNVNNILFGNVPLHGQLANVAYAHAPWLKLTAYGYLLDFADDSLAARRDTKTLGLRVAGDAEAGPGKFVYAAEFAQQSDYQDAPDTVDADYSLLELGYGTKAITGKLGHEVLGSNDGKFGLQTPLATIHAHDGWADQIGTPVNGVKNTYLALNGAMDAWSYLLRYHQWKADFGGADYGTEVNALLSYAVNEGFLLTAKYADYSADSFPAAGTPPAPFDTRKTWLMAEYKF